MNRQATRNKMGRPERVCQGRAGQPERTTGAFVSPEILQREIQSRILAAISTESETWKRLVRACGVYLDACLDPAVQRIVLLDAPRVFSRQTLFQLQAETGSGLIGQGLMRMFLQELMDRGITVRHNAWTLSVLLSGALESAALEIALSPDKELWRRELGAGFVSLLERLKISPEEKDHGRRKPKPKRSRKK